jgi:hypothetical protein
MLPMTGSCRDPCGSCGAFDLVRAILQTEFTLKAMILSAHLIKRATHLLSRLLSTSTSNLRLKSYREEDVENISIFSFILI